MTTEPVVKRARWPWIVGPIVLIGLCAAFTMDWSGGEPAKPGAPKPAAAGLTLAAFEKVKTGDDCAGLDAAFGMKGVLSSETEAGDMKFQSFDWIDANILGSPRVVTIMCHNGKVDTKAQSGLR
jgi:hypothetical protein